MLRACTACGLVHKIPASIPPRHVARCTRCDTRITRDAHPRTRSRAAALALAALILYPVALTLPIMEIERFGHAHETTILGGVTELIAAGDLIVGIVVLFCSVVAPIGKLLAIFVLCAGPASLSKRRLGSMHNLVAFLGRWGMVDVLLVAVLVAAVKLGDWAEVHAGSGVLVFCAVVILSLLAGLVFDPRVIWSEEDAEAAR